MVNDMSGPTARLGRVQLGVSADTPATLLTCTHLSKVAVNHSMSMTASPHCVVHNIRCIQESACSELAAICTTVLLNLNTELGPLSSNVWSYKRSQHVLKVTTH